MCLILKVYRDRGFRGYRPNSVRFLFVGLDEERNLQKKGGYTRRLARPRFGCCCRIKNREDQLRRTTRDRRTGASECTEVEGGIFDHIFLLFVCFPGVTTHCGCIFTAL